MYCWFWEQKRRQQTLQRSQIDYVICKAGSNHRDKSQNKSITDAMHHGKEERSTHYGWDFVVFTTKHFHNVVPILIHKIYISAMRWIPGRLVCKIKMQFVLNFTLKESGNTGSSAVSISSSKPDTSGAEALWSSLSVSWFYETFIKPWQSVRYRAEFCTLSSY